MLVLFTFEEDILNYIYQLYLVYVCFTTSKVRS